MQLAVHHSFEGVRAVGEFLLISDDLRRAERLARDLGPFGECRIHDLYDEVPQGCGADIVISDVAGLNSDAILRLRGTLSALRGKGVPYLFIVHGNRARAEAQARALGASETLTADALAQRLRTTLAHLRGSARPVPDIALQRAEEGRQFFQDAFFSGRAVTPALAERGTGLIARAVQETGIQDWVTLVQRFDDATYQHCLLVAGLAASFSGALGLGAADRQRLVKAALLHDVGKTAIPTAILNKPGKLDEAEMALMRTHPARGHAMLVGRGFEDEILTVVRSHHEMLDGSGYPDKLRGAEIPDFVRLVTVCDTYGALIERRPYRAPMSGEEAYGVLESMEGRLDADIVRAFRAVAAAMGAFAGPETRPDPRAT